MRNLFKVFISAMLLALAISCAMESDPEIVSENVRRYIASFEESTKTGFSVNGGKCRVSWTEGDELYCYTQVGQANATETKISIEGYNAVFEVSRGQADQFINAVYGASVLSSSTSSETVMYVNSPVTGDQNYTSFAQAHVCAAFSDDVENPHLRFHNAASVLTFTGAAPVVRVVIHGNNNETITCGSNGAMMVMYEGGAVSSYPAKEGGTSISVSTNGAESDFYVAILPVVFSAGITVECYDAGDKLIAKKVTDNELRMISETGDAKVLYLGNALYWIGGALPVAEAVDLGLSVKWANFNLGASNPEEYGEYFAWGETSPKGYCDWATYKWSVDSHDSLLKYNYDESFGTIDYKIALDLEDDAAHVNWGGDWRLPTDAEWSELLENCQGTWTTMEGVNGFLFISKKPGYNDKSIFLPVAGYRFYDYLVEPNSYGLYWSSSLYAFGPNLAQSIYITESGVRRPNFGRMCAATVRPVQGEFVPVSDVHIRESFVLYEGRSAKLPYSVLPENATAMNVTWTSSDKSVATVDGDGLVDAIAPGTTSITVISSDGSKSAVCNLTVKETPRENGYEYVDLGLSVKWATCNVGATVAEEFGDHIAWGESEPKTEYLNENYIFYDATEKNTYTKYNSEDNKTVLEPEDDAAHVRWGGKWRMPTEAEWAELIENCEWTWITQNGVKGRRVTSNVEGYTHESIFLPAAGSINGTYVGSGSGDYWSSTLDSPPNLAFAHYIYFHSAAGIGKRTNARISGQSIRPVTE